MEEKPCLWITESLTPFSQIHHGVKKIFLAKQTKYQYMVVADIGPYGKALVLDGKIQTTVGDEYLYHEPLVHIPSILHGNPEKILVLGGADLGAAREALKWKSLKSVTVVDIDGDVVDACQKYLPEISQEKDLDPRCNLIVGDALDFIDNTEEKFDVIIGDLTDPIDDGPSLELFTESFYTRVKRCLSENGVYVTQAGSISQLEEQVFPRVAHTMNHVFDSVRPFCSFIPTFGTPLGFVIGFDRGNTVEEKEHQYSVESVNAKLETSLYGGLESLRELDGTSFAGHFGLPKNVRKAISEESVLYK